MKYFISHSSKDKSAVEKLVEIMSQYEPDSVNRENLFCSSIPENGSDFKEELIFNINENISKAENIILVITESYLRSTYCFYEMSIARYLKAADRKIILIVSNESIASRIDDIFPSKAFLHINAETEIASETLAASLGFKTDFKPFFSSLTGVKAPAVPYIGMPRDAYALKYRFIEEYGVEKIGFDYPSTPDEVEKKLQNAREIYFVSTTGSGFLKTYKDILTACVARGSDLRLVIGDKGSAFSSDVAEIEAFDGDSVRSQLKKNNELRIESEFLATFQYLNEIYVSSRNQASAGKIYCGSSYTLIRQTAFIARNKDGSLWGWITCTMPPVRSADKTPSVVFEGDLNNTLVNDVWKYASSLFSLSKHKGSVVEIDGTTPPERLDSSDMGKGFSETLERYESYWREHYKAAQDYMETKNDLFDGVLIEVAAQHPLKNRRVPNKEFEARLNRAIELYNKYTADGEEVSVYVPGSRHTFNGVADEVSLSDAGKEYLVGKGIPKECIFGDEANLQYKGVHGVYNSADECFVASEIFKNGQFGRLVSVCSPNQIMRKSMLYVEFGCIPLCYGVTTEKMYHKNVVNEIFGSLNRVLYTDHSWQDENSDWFKYFRETRRPKSEDE